MLPSLVLSDDKGDIYVHPSLKMMARDLEGFVTPDSSEFIPLPKGSTFFSLPGHTAIGFDEDADEVVRVKKLGDREIMPVAAFMIPGFVRTFLPAAEKTDKKLILPLWPYTAVGYLKGRFYVTAKKTDRSIHQRPIYYKNTRLLKSRVDSIRKKFVSNRLIRHLSHCALNYNCRNAQNLFFKRWEAPLPVSPACNAGCLGCLSFQEPGCAIGSHHRINFVPTPEEVSQVGIYHLLGAKNPMVSFGQGCEGEPLLELDTIIESIRLMRNATNRGVIHLNTNGSRPEALAFLSAAGLDSIRISTVSFSPENYRAYYRPRGYSFSDVLESIRQAKKNRLFVSLNLLTMPGYTDSSKEVKHLIHFLKKGYVDLLQFRNLSIDVDFFKQKMSVGSGKIFGIRRMMALVKKEVPKLKFGYFNPRFIR